MDEAFLQRLKRFRTDHFPRYEERFRDLVANGQHPTTLFIGCSDSRIVPYLLTGMGPGELFIVRNVGALVPPVSGLHGLHGTAAGIEFAVLSLNVRHIVVCGHSHCGAMRALYGETPAEAVHLKAWLDLGREAALPEAPSEEVLRRTEQRSIVLQLERLMAYPMVKRRVEQGALALHGWHYVIEDGEIHVFDIDSGRFVAASKAPLHRGDEPANECDVAHWDHIAGAVT